MLKPPVFGKEKSDSIILELKEQSFRVALFESMPNMVICNNLYFFIKTGER